MNERIAVVGAGQMGSGIAHVAALSGYPVTMIDVAESALDKGRAAIGSNLERQVKKGTIDAGARDAALSRITTTTSLDGSADAAVIIEAATERVELKYRIFEELDRIASAGATRRSTSVEP